jgi:Fis family transcriptional regulator
MSKRHNEEMGFEEVVHAKLRTFLRRMDGYDLYDAVIARVERPLLELVLEQTGGNQLKAAHMLGLNRNTLRKKLAEHGLATSASAAKAKPVLKRKRG